MTESPKLAPDQVPDGWNATAAGYNRDVWDFMTPFVSDAIAHADLAPDHELLDVAAGTGRVALEVAPRVKRVLAVDFAADMLRHLDERVAAGGYTNVETRQMDGQALELADESFDRVMCNFGVIFFPDKGAGCREMRRVLRPGGRAVVTSWSGPDKFEAFHLFGEGLRAALPDMPAPDAPPPIFSLCDPELFQQTMREAGFSTVDVHSVTHPFEMESPEAAWELLSQSAPPLVALLKTLPDGAVGKVEQEVIARIRAARGDGPITLTAEAHIGVAVRS